MAATPELSVVLPCRNQADHIEGVLRAWPPALEAAGISFEIIAVPNACTDETPGIVARVAQADPRIRVVENPAGGWGKSVRMGLEAAGGSAACFTNSARTDPATLVAVFELYRRKAPCLAKAVRTARGAPVRGIGSWLYNLEARLLFGIRCRDVNGTPKILPVGFVGRFDLAQDGDLLDLEVLVRAARLGVPVVELEVPGFRRHGGVSTTTWGSAWRMYAGALRLRMMMMR